MATIAEIVTELSKPAYAAAVAAGSNGELVAALNTAQPFQKRWRAVPVDTFKALVADKWAGLSAVQKETVRFLLEGDAVRLEDATVLDAVKAIFTDAATRTALADAAREEDVVSLKAVREAVRQIPAALVNQPPPPPNVTPVAKQAEQ